MTSLTTAALTLTKVLWDDCLQDLSSFKEDKDLQKEAFLQEGRFYTLVLDFTSPVWVWPNL